MKTPDDIKKGLASCSADECHGDHADCPYIVDIMCIRNICGDALAYIQQLERERDAAVDCLAMTKECKTCKHFSSHTASEEPCRYCGIRQNAWEWRGVKEDDK